MKLSINLDGINSNAALRNHFGVDGMTSATTTYTPNKKTLKSIFICGMTIKSGDRFFHHLALLISEAIEEKQMEEEGNMMIGAMRTLECAKSHSL